MEVSIDTGDLLEQHLLFKSIDVMFLKKVAS